MDLGLKDKIAVITGGSEGIGKATAMLFAQEGAKVAICARHDDVLQQTAEDIRKATRGDVLAVRADVMNPMDMDSLINRTVEAYGGIDILVNNAGSAAGGAFESVSDEAWQADLELKLFGAIRCSRLVIPHMKARGGGRIINITMIGGKQPGAGSMPSSVSRAAGIALTKALSKEFAADNILVNTVCVGAAKSGQVERGARRRYPDMSLEDAYREIGKGIPIGRVAEASEVASAILFLASSAGSYITGAAINVDGGVSGAV